VSSSRLDELKRLQQHIDDATRAGTAITVRRDGEARLANVVGQLNEVVTILKADGTWDYSSEAGTRILGYPKGAEIDGGLFSLLHPDDFEPASAALAQVLAGTRRPDESLDLRVRDAAGDYHIFETVGINLVDHPVIEGVLVIARDVTEQRQAAERARETTRTLEALLASLRDGVLFVDDAHRVVFANQPALAMLDLRTSPDALVGETVHMMRGRSALLVEDRVAFGERLEQLFADGQPAAGDELRSRDGRILERDYVPVRLESGRHGHLFLFRDVTEQRIREEQQEGMLEAERSLRAAMEEQNRTLLELADMKSQFIADVSHELRTPLSSIMGYTELLLDESTESEMRTKFTEAIDRNAWRLLRVVDDLLIANKLESGGMALERRLVKPGVLVESAVSALRPHARAAQVDLRWEAEGDGFVLVDPGRIDQLLVNLMSNAIKFTPDGGRVVVRSRIAPGTWLIDVSDTGIGIPDAELPQLFHRFYRGSNVRGKIAGTGLGLMICRSIVELHGGAISVESIEGSGTTIRIALPISQM
jgi:PAS domain S-box-containing protein